MKGAVHKNKGELIVSGIALCAISSNIGESEIAVNAANETLSLVNWCLVVQLGFIPVFFFVSVHLFSEFLIIDIGGFLSRMLYLRCPAPYVNAFRQLLKDIYIASWFGLLKPKLATKYCYHKHILTIKTKGIFNMFLTYSYRFTTFAFTLVTTFGQKSNEWMKIGMIISA